MPTERRGSVSFLARILIGRQLGAEALVMHAIANVFVALIRTLQDCLVLESMAVLAALQTSEERQHYSTAPFPPR